MENETCTVRKLKLTYNKKSSDVGEKFDNLHINGIAQAQRRYTLVDDRKSNLRAS